MDFIKQLCHSDADALVLHLQQHSSESGTDGDIIFMPEPAKPWPLFRQQQIEQWRKALHEPGWCRSWAIFDDMIIAAHVSLRGAEHPSGLHRTAMGLSVLRPHRRKGHGRLLSAVAIDWAKTQSTIDWIDLWVYNHNIAAKSLYRQLGFQEIGITRDHIRVGGLPIDDVAMALNVALR